jgi:hypothetical protein
VNLAYWHSRRRGIGKLWVWFSIEQVPVLVTLF